MLHKLDNYFRTKPGLCEKGVCDTITLSEGTVPVNQPPRQIPGGIRDAVKTELEKLIGDGIIVESKAEWTSPLVPVKKKDGSIRLCVDFRALNSCTPLVDSGSLP